MLSLLRPTSIASSRRRGVIVVTIVGPVSASGGDMLLRAEVKDALDAGERRLILDFSTLSALDSSGLGELVRASDAVCAVQGRMAWAGCPKTMLDLFEITGVSFDGVDFVDSVDDALLLYS